MDVLTVAPASTTPVPRARPCVAGNIGRERREVECEPVADPAPAAPSPPVPARPVPA
ncbi:hypothetical protein [Geodermatophilus marinus]|uniref:hypothetical protein n=1 Tax=Geodermatophilus sp. LHW52908 TaxID=2303986 RepID=UPI001313F156|nr:hypothetical protein [Geodermatophilus sp. LHW52908]